MSDEDKLSQARSKALRAQNLLENELFNEALAKNEERLITAWTQTGPHETASRESLWFAVQANRKQKDYLAAIVNMDGKMADAQLKELADVAERKKRFGIIR